MTNRCLDLPCLTNPHKIDLYLSTILAASLSLVSTATQTMDVNTNPADEQLVSWIAAVVQHDESALLALYERTLNRVYSFAFSFVKNAEDAEEITEDVFLAVWHQADRYDDTRGTVMAWLMTLCRSRALDRLRSIRRQPSVTHALDDGVAEEGTVDELEWLVDGSKLAAALAHLPNTQREILMLAYFKGLSHSEIAETLQLSLGTVKTHIRRTLIELRREFGSE